jgi:uncharacterized FlaG/YvyC family protein
MNSLDHLMSAKEARNKTNLNLGDRAQEKINTIVSAINKAVNDNKFSVRVNTTLEDDIGKIVRVKLLEKNYVIKDIAATCYGRDDDCSHIIISW